MSIDIFFFSSQVLFAFEAIMLFCWFGTASPGILGICTCQSMTGMRCLYYDGQTRCTIGGKYHAFLLSKIYFSSSASLVSYGKWLLTNIFRHGQHTSMKLTLEPHSPTWIALNVTRLMKNTDLIAKCCEYL